MNTHPKIAKAKENYKVFSISLQVHLVNDETIPTPKEPTSHVNLIKYMNIDNRFDFII